MPPYDPVAFPLQGLSLESSGRRRRVTSADALVSSHYYLQNQPNPVPEGCVDPRRPPPIYSMGAKPNGYTYWQTGRIGLFSDLAGKASCESASDYVCGAPSVRGIDCSGFIVSSLAAAGLKFRTDQRPSFIGTTSFVSEVDPDTHANSCFSRVSPSQDSGRLRSGDLFIVPGNHVLIIDSAGPDPFGISRVSQCSEISPAHFDFRVIQSSGTGNGIGVNRMEASQYFGGILANSVAAAVSGGHSSLGFLGPLLDHARRACQMAREGAPRTASRSSIGQILRHKGGAACSTSAANFGDQDCTASCDLGQTGGPAS